MIDRRDLQAELDKCAVCGKCRAFCPVFRKTLDESKVARGRIRLADSYLRGDISATRKLGDYVNTCLKCYRCEANCPSGVDYGLIIDAIRIELVGRRPVPILLRLVLRRLLFWRWGFDVTIRLAAFFSKLVPRRGKRLRHLPLFILGGRGMPPIARRTALSWVRERPTSPAGETVTFFVGCLMNYVYPEAARSCVEALERLGLRVIIPEDQLCCGAPALSVGDVQAVEKLARRNMEVLTRENPSAVIVGCASCAGVLRKEYPKLFGDEFSALSSKVRSFSEFLAERGEFEWDRQRRSKVTYHDPCHLKWLQDIYVEPRALLREAAEFVEMEDADMCCGLGGLFGLFHHDISAEIGNEKARSVMESGAEVVVTECPGCMLQLEDRLSASGAAVEVKHISQVLCEAMVGGKLRSREEKVAGGS